MKFETVEEYKKEIERVEKAMKSTNSFCLHRDYSKYKKRLEIEMRLLMK